MKQWHLFDPDNTVYRALLWYEQQVVINLLTLLLSIPVITAGMAVHAMYQVQLRLLSGEEIKIGQAYFKAVRENWKQATLIWVYFLLFLLVCSAWVLFFRYSGTDIAVAAKILVFMVMIMGCAVMSFTYPVLAKYHSSFKQTILISVAHMLKHFHLFLVKVAVTVGPVFVLAQFSFWTNLMLAWVWLFGGISCLNYIHSKLYWSATVGDFPEQNEIAG